MCASNKCAPQMPWICHMPKLLNMNWWARDVNTYATYEAVSINEEARMGVQPVMMVPQPDYKYWVGH